MKKIIFAFSCVFLMSGAAVADERYEVVVVRDSYVIVDTKKERSKICNWEGCKPWKSWGK